MALLKTALLAAVYGISKFFPISNQAHLDLLQKILKFHQTIPAFYPMVQLGALFAIFAHFSRPILRMLRETVLLFLRLPSAPNRGVLLEEFPHGRMAGFILLATVPAVGIHWTFRENLETAFGWLLVSGLAWLVMGLVLIASRRFQDGTRTLYEINHHDAFVIGLAQGIAILPGISRTEFAVLAALFCGMVPTEAVRFSFLLAVPLLAGSIFLEVEHGVHFFETAPAVLAVSFLTAALMGYLAIGLVLKLVERRLFFVFGCYCLLAGLGALAYNFIPR